MVLALLVHTPCGLTLSRRTVVVGGIASSLGLAPLPVLAADEPAPEAVQRLAVGRRAQSERVQEDLQRRRGAVVFVRIHGRTQWSLHGTVRT